MNLDRNQLETFAAVIESRHFGHAARALNITRGAVSQRIIALEQAVGTPLLVRDRVAPTPAGEAILRHVQVLKLLEADTLRQIKPEGIYRTPIAIAVNADSLATWFESVACDIARGNFALELIVDDQDHTLPVLARGEAMGCVSTASNAPIGFVAEGIGAMEYECVATPDFSQTYFPRGLNLHDILAAPAVLYNRKDGLHALFLESFLGFSVNVYSAHYFPSPVALLAAIQAGVGYGLVPSLQAGSLIESGNLVALAPHSRVTISLYWHHWETAPPNARAISEMVMRRARQVLIQSPVGSGGKRDEGGVED